MPYDASCQNARKAHVSDVVYLIEQHGPLSAPEVGSMLGVSRATAWRTLLGAYDLGYIKIHKKRYMLRG